MRPQEVLTKFLKSIGADTRAGLVQYILVALILTMGGLSALYKKTRDVSIQILTTPTPLWATILLVLLGYLYIYLRFRKSSVSTPNQSKIEYFTVGEQIWKVKVFDHNNYRIIDEGLPICKKHNLTFISSHNFYHCPEADNDNCTNIIEYNDMDKYIVKANSYIGKQLRER